MRRAKTYSPPTLRIGPIRQDHDPATGRIHPAYADTVEGTRLRAVREEVGLTIEQAARRCGWPTDCHERLEIGARRMEDDAGWRWVHAQIRGDG